MVFARSPSPLPVRHCLLAFSLKDKPRFVVRQLCVALMTLVVYAPDGVFANALQQV